MRIDPSTLDIAPPALTELRDHGAATVRDVLAGRPGPIRDIVLLNAAAALMAVDPDSTLRANRDRCAEAIDSGAAGANLHGWIEAARSV